MNKESFFKQIGQFRRNAVGKVPSVKNSQLLLRSVISLLFPILSKKDKIDLESDLNHIEIQLSCLLQSISYTDVQANELTQAFIDRFEAVYQLLIKDAEAIYKGDPAAESIEEVIVSYPGFFAITIHRIAHELYKLNIPVLPRLFSEYGHKETGIDIHPGASIGASFCIDHGTGVVIGETTEIGKQVKIYQGVTLGALSVNKDKAGSKRHPTIGDHVTIYSGTTILGGKTVVGNHSVIGGNVWLTHSVEDYSIVLNKNEVYVKNKNPEYDQVIDFVI
ncbi:MAG: serine O-acetyltransferase [Salinivirgaceae bacterium]